MKRPRRRSAAIGTRDHPSQSGGPLRRRRSLRDLHSLAQEAAREPSPTAATAHVRVLGDSDEPVSGGDVPPPVVSNRRLETEEGSSPQVSTDESAHRVRAVPIDQPFGASP
jgi:hypothetical protein